MQRILTLLFIASISTLFAQDVDVTSSTELPNQYQTGSWKNALGQDETGYYLLREYGSPPNVNVILEKYSPSFQLLYSTNIPYSRGSYNNSKTHRYTAMNNGKVYVFQIGWNKQLQQNSFHISEVNEFGVMNENSVELETEPATGQVKSANYSFSFSPDGSKLLVMTEKPFVKGTNETLRLQVFETEKFASLWKQDLTLENEFEKDPTNNVIVDNHGTAFMLKDIKVNMKQRIYQLITTGSDFSKLSVIDLQDYNLGQFKMQFDPTGNLLINGMLVPAGRSASEWQGLWFCKVDASGKTIHNNLEPIGSELLSSVFSPGNAAKEGKTINNVILKSVLMKSDGGVLFLTEEHTKNQSMIEQGAGMIPVYTFTFGNVFIISYDSEGNRVWNKVIEKSQSEKTMNYKSTFGSFAYQVLNEKLYVVWNYTDILLDPLLNNSRYWLDKNGSKIYVDRLYGKDAFYPTMLTVLDPDGNFDFREQSFNSLPLDKIQKGNSFSMAADPTIFFTTEQGMIILSRMPGIDAKRFKFSKISY